MEYKLIVPGVPIAKKRPRFARVGKFVRTYNCQETEEGRFLFEVKLQWRLPPLSCPIDLTCDFCMAIPKGTSKKTMKGMLAHRIQHTKRPDLDNLLKFVKDCFNGVVWKDDSQVFQVQATKHYGEEPKTTIIIKTEGDGIDLAYTIPITR